jgi:hypothetical protein
VTTVEQLLSRPQRNDLFRALESSGAPVSEFQLEVGLSGALQLEAGSRNEQGILIRHVASKSFFFIKGFGTYGISGTHGITGSLMNGDPSMTETQGRAGFVKALHLERPLTRSGSIFKAAFAVANQGLSVAILSWDEIVPLVETWANAVISGFREYEATPDLWAELGQSKELFAAHHENTPFTKAEQAEISGQIQRIRTFISINYDLNADQLAEVSERLDDIEEASRRLGRKDWLNAFNGAVLSLVLTELVPPQAMQRIIMIGLQGLGHLFGLGGPPTPLP